MSMPSFSHQKGFTLLEVLIYATLVGLLAVASTTGVLWMLKSQGRSETTREVHDALRLATEKISADLRAASAVSAPATPGASAATLALTLGSETITYEVSDGRLRRQLNSATPEPITATTVVVAAPVFARLENLNSVLGAATVTVQTALSISSASAAPDRQFSETRSFSTSLW